MNARVVPLETPAAAPAMDRRIEPRRRRRALIAGAGVAGAMVLGVFVLRALPGAGERVVAAAEVASSPVVRAPFEDVLPVRGEVAPLRTVYVTAVEGGQVSAVLAADGARVDRGAALASLSNPRLALDVTAREAEIAGRLGDVSGQQLQLQRNRLDREREVGETAYNLLKARRELELRRGLHAKGFVSDAELKTVADEAAYHDARLATLRAGQGAEDAIAAAQARGVAETSARLRSNLDVVRGSLGALVVRAPAAGRLTAFDLQPGQALAAGDRVGQIDSEDAYKLVAEVDEFHLARVSPGQAAWASSGGRTYPLTVDRVLSQVTDGRFRVELTFTGEAPPDLRRGQTLDLRIVLGETRTALILPNGPWLESAGGTHAFVLAANGRAAERRPVRIGRRSPTQVEVAEGLRPGERVVTSSYAEFDRHDRLVLR